MNQGETFLATRFREVTVPYALDDGPGRHRIGLIVPAEDAVSERDFRLMLPNDQVAVFTNRIETTQICSMEELRKMEPLLQQSASLVLSDDHIDVLAFSCTSATVAIGYGQVAAAMGAARPSTPIVTPISAALAAFQALEVGSLAVLTPYPDDVNAPIHDYLVSHKLDVLNFSAFKGLLTDYEVSRIPPQAIYEAGLQADDPRAEALFISCTGIRAAEIADRLEHALGKPVVTSNQAMFWECLRRSGFNQSVSGFGTLMNLQTPRVSGSILHEPRQPREPSTLRQASPGRRDSS